MGRSSPMATTGIACANRLQCQMWRALPPRPSHSLVDVRGPELPKSTTLFAFGARSPDCSMGLAASRMGLPSVAAAIRIKVHDQRHQAQRKGSGDQELPVGTTST